MGAVRDPKPVLLFVGILTSIPELLPEVGAELAARFGEVAARSEVFPFDATHYYDSEMGAPLVRQFVAFGDPVGPEALVAAKLATNEIEQAFSLRRSEVARPVNLDPGYLNEAKLVLASTKDFSHRILLSKGIYAEVTLHFEAREWRAFPWTFPDYRSGRYSAFFGELRRLYRVRLGKERG